MKNPINNVVSEIGGWLKNHGYVFRHIFVVTFVYFYVSSKISQEDCNEFEREFGQEIHLKDASFDGNGIEKEFEYTCDHELLIEFRQYLRGWLASHNISCEYISITKDISMHCNERLSETQISEFEDEIGVKYMGYSLNCGSNDIEYIFGWNFENSIIDLTIFS